MNRCYRLVFNRSTQVWQVVSEMAKSHSKSAAIVLLPLFSLVNQSYAWAEPGANALPSGGQVVAGQSAITQNGNQLNIVQGTDKSIINWQSYNIGSNAQVNYVQNNASAISLNRVVTGDPSAIFGKLSANGQVWLINPNGVLFGQGAQVNVGGLLASTLNIADDDFMAGKYQFTASNGSVVNLGAITASQGGYVALLAPEVRNEGVISAMQGTVALAAGNAMTLDFSGSGLINVQVDSASVNTLVENKHLIQVGNGQVLMSTKAADGLITSVINNSGKIEANSMVSDGGVIRLTGAKTVINSGNISATSSVQKGGTVHLLGDNVGMLNAGSVNVSGKTGGGTILVGGDFQGKNANIQNASRTFVGQNAQLIADATASGDGGKVIVWANDIARYYGSTSAKGGTIAGNGGFVEVSGKRLLNFFGNVDLSAANGVGGNLLLDPENITISNGVDSNTLGFTGPLNVDLTEAFADDAGLNSVFDVTVGTGSFAGVTAGSTITLQANNDITIANAFDVATATGSANNSLVLEANNNITINSGATLSTTGTGSLTLKADADSNGTGNLAIGAAIATDIGGANLSGANVTSTASGSINTTGATNTNSGNVNITASDSIMLSGSITTTGVNATTVGLNAGNVNLLAGKSINASGISIVANGSGGVSGFGGGNAGSVSAIANTGISISSIQNSGGNASGNGNGGNAGNITIRNQDNPAFATGDIVMSGNIITRTGSAATGGVGGSAATINIHNQADTGIVSLLNISANGLVEGNGADVSISSETTLATALINTNAGGAITQSAGKNAGNILISAGSVNVQAINASGSDGVGTSQSGGNGGTVSITATTGSLVAQNITALGGSGSATDGNGGNGGNVALNGSAGSTVTMRNILTTGGNRAGTGTGMAGAGGSILIAGDALLAVNSTLSSTGGSSGVGIGGAITFNGTLNSTGASRTLTVNNNAATTFAGAIGNSLALTSLTTDLTGSTIFNGGSVNTIGAQTYNDAVILGAATTFTTTNSNINFANSINANGNNVVIAAGAGALTATNVANDFGSLAVTAASADVRDANAIAFAATNVAGAYTLQTAGNVTQTAGVVIGGASTFNPGAAGNIVLTNAANDFNSVAINSANNVSLVDSNALTVGASTVTSIVARTLSNNLTLGGNIAASGAGDAVVLAAAANFLNPGSSTLSTPSGRWLIYANTHTGNTFGGLISGNQAIYGRSFPAATAETGNRYVFANSPTLNVTSTNQTKTYGQDATSTVANSFTAATFVDAAAFGGVFTQDTLANSLTGSATSAGSAVTANVATYVIDVTPITSTNGYTLNKSNAGNLNVNAALVNLAGSRVYNGATGFDAGAFSTFATGVNGETLNVTGSGGSVASKNAGAAQTLTTGGLALADGTGLATNYTLTGGTHTGTITAATLSLNAATDSKTYNGDTSSSATVTTSGLALGDTVTGLSQSFTSKNVLGTNLSTLNVNAGYTVNDGNSGNNYTVATNSATGTITAATLNLNAATDSKTYNGNTSSSGIVATSGLVGGDTVTNLTQSYASKNVLGTNLSTLNVNSGYTVNDGNSGNNYTVATNAAAGTITAATLSLNAVTDSKTYNGNASSSAIVATSGLVGGDTVTGLTQSYASKNVLGTNLSTLNVNVGYTVNDGNSGNNYTVATNAAAGTITAATLSLNAVTDSKTYNGNTSSSAIVATSGLAGGDTVTGLSQSFASKNVLGLNGSTLNVNAGYSVNDGNSGNNYTVATNSAVGTITKATLNLNAVTDSKTYNGNTSSSAIVATSGLVGGDTVTGLSQSFASKNVLGTNLSTLNVNTGYTLNDGNSGNNYTVATNTAAGTITTATLSLSAAADSKTYDGNTSSSGIVATSGLVGGDTVTGLTQSYASKNVLGLNGSTLNINAGYTVNDGNSGNNYTVAAPSSAMGTITEASLSITANDTTKVQGTPNPAFTSTINGFVGGDTAAVLAGSLDYTTLADATSPAGTYTVTPFGVSANNYAISFIDGALDVVAFVPPPNTPSTSAGSDISVFNNATTRPEQAIQTCSQQGTSQAMINGLDEFGVDDVDYQSSISQPQVGGVIANGLAGASCSIL